MPLDDITLKAQAMFANGIKDAVQTIQTTRTLQRANQEIQAIKQSTLSEAKQRLAFEDLSRQVVFNLTQVGANANSVQQIADAIAPAIRQPQTIQEALVAPSADVRQRGREAQDFMAQFTKKKDEKESFTPESFSKSLKDFRLLPNVKEDMSKLSAVQDAETFIKRGTAQAFNLAVKQMVKSIEGGRLTDLDFELGQPGQDIISKIKRKGATKFLDKMTQNDQQQLLDMVRSSSKVVRSRLSSAAKNRASALAGGRGDVDVNRLADNFLRDVGAFTKDESNYVTETHMVNGKRFEVTYDPESRQVLRMIPAK